MPYDDVTSLAFKESFSQFTHCACMRTSSFGLRGYNNIINQRKR